MAKKPKLLSDMFHDTLKDVYFAENKILKTLPKMAKAAQSKDLKAAFVKHERETRGHVKRLEGVFKILGKPARAKTCDAIMGITKEGAEIMTEYKGMPALDAGLLAAAQAVEHYEISRYGTLRTWAEELGLSDAVALLEATLKEEKATDETKCHLESRCRVGSDKNCSSGALGERRRRRPRSWRADGAAAKKAYGLWARARLRNILSRRVQVLPRRARRIYDRSIAALGAR